MKKNTIFNTAEYIRLSKEDGDKEESNSVGNQRKFLTEYIKSQADFSLYDTYVDDGYSGTNFNRPNFKRMIEDIQAGKVNCVIVKDLSRFGRDYIDTGRYLERLFPELGVRFIAISDNIDSMKYSYDMLLPIKNIFNEQYARDISKKIQITVKSKQKSGEFIGAFTSYGYKKSAIDKNKLVIDEYAADVVRKIFTLFIKGYGKQRIAKNLNEQGVLCPSEYKTVNGENYKNHNRLDSTTYWSYSTIHNMLQREMYIGNMVQGTKHQTMRSKQQAVDRNDWIIVESTHEPIIDKATFDKVQILLNNRTRELDLESNQSIFAGFLKCGDCGRSMAKNFWKRADGSRNYAYSCGTYKRIGKEYCTPHSIPLEVLEKIVMSDLKKLIQSVGDLKELVKLKCLDDTKTNWVAESESNKLKAELERVMKLKKSLYEDYKDGMISKEEFFSYREDYQKKEELYSKQILAIEDKKNEKVTTDIFQTPWLKRLLDLGDIQTLDRDIITEMISQITVYENKRIKIIYNFSNELEHLFNNVYSKETKPDKLIV